MRAVGCKEALAENQRIQAENDIVLRNALDDPNKVTPRSQKPRSLHLFPISVCSVISVVESPDASRGLAKTQCQRGRLNAR